MPFLEQRRGPQPTVARKLQRLIQYFSFLFPKPQHWALTWSIFHLLSFVLGGWLAGQLNIFLPTQLLHWRLYPVFLSALFPAGFSYIPQPLTPWLIWLPVFLLGTVAGYSESLERSSRVAVSAPGIMEPSRSNSWTAKTLLRTTGWPVLRDKGKWQIPAIIVRIEVINSTNKNMDSPRSGQGILVTGKGSVPVPGQLLAATQTITIPSGGDLPGMFDYRYFLAGRSIQWRGKIIDHKEAPNPTILTRFFTDFLSPFRKEVLSNLKTILPPLEASLAGAVLLGAKDKSSRSTGEPFSDLGLAHLFAVSGLHVGVLLGLFLLPGKLLGISSWQKWLFLWLILPPYALLTGLPGSVVRASGLALLATASMPFGRRGKPLHFLGFLFWATTIWNPDQVLDTGVRLSYVAAGGILSFSMISAKINYPKKGILGFILGGLFISFSAQWFTLPLAASSFGRLSLLSPLANLAAVPTFGMAVWLIVLALVFSLIPSPLGPALGALAWLLLRVLEGLVGHAQNLTGGFNIGLPVPGPGLVLTWIMASMSILLVLRFTATGQLKRRWAILAISLTGLFTISQFNNSVQIESGDAGPEVWQFDVGQGDGSMVRFPDGWSAMIDNGGRFGFGGSDLAGPWSRSILPWLRRHKLDNPDVVILSHGHLDHTGGSGIMLQDCNVDQWMVAGNADRCLLPDSQTIKVHFPVQGEIVHRWQDWTLVIRYPLQQIPNKFHENDFSIVVALQHNGNTQYLWSGDLEKNGEELLLGSGGPGGKTRIWKAGHHGSNTSGSQPFLNVIHPDLILISCGVGNRYHHPSHGFYVVDGDTIEVVRTDLEGSIHIKFNQNGHINWKSRQREGHLGALP